MAEVENSDGAKPLRFTQKQRLKTPEEFRRVFDRRRSSSDERLLVYVCENELGYSRLGVSVSKKVGNAVVRNRWKRLFREIFRLLQWELPAGFDFVLVPRGTAEGDFDLLLESLRKLAAQAISKLKR